MEFFKTPNIDFLSKRRVFFVLSSLLILSSLILLFVKGPTYGIDFTGGTLLHIHTDKDITTSTLRGALAKVNLAKSEIQEISLKEHIIKYSEDIDPDSVVNFLNKSLNLNIKVERAEKVGPRIGKELRLKAIYAVLIGMVLMLIYIAIRFNLSFGIASILALFHDVIITLGVFILLSKEITTSIIAAFLTIVGYSINDSIVISDRIRENLKKRQGKFIDIANRSINETLSRTIITAGTTLLVLIVLLFLGGPLLFDFALTLIIGIAVGTYSSIFIVAALVVEYEEIRSKKLRKK
ncbi:MAG: protein translocase subunit SecF [Candidatus Hydrothermales bacterium]